MGQSPRPQSRQVLCTGRHLSPEQQRDAKMREHLLTATECLLCAKHRLHKPSFRTTTLPRHVQPPALLPTRETEAQTLRRWVVLL